MSTKQTELQSLVAEWVELPAPGSGQWFLHIAVTHGSGKVIEDWLTQYQAEEVVIVAEQKPWRAK